MQLPTCPVCLGTSSRFFISENGYVTLKGPVRSDDERNAVFAKAVEVAGKDRVANELTVAPEKK